MVLFQKQISYWNNEYSLFAAGSSLDEEIDDGSAGILESMEAIDAVFASDNVDSAIDLAGLYLNVLLRPRTTFYTLSGINDSQRGDSISLGKSENIERLLSSKQIVDAGNPLFCNFDLDLYLEQSSGDISTKDLTQKLEEVESEFIENMTLDSIMTSLTVLSNFLNVDQPVADIEVDEASSALLDYKAAVILMDEKGFESVAAKIQFDFNGHESFDITIDDIISYIIESLDELEEAGQNKYEFSQ